MKLRTIAIGLLLIGLAMVIGGYIMPPPGVIDESLIKVFGEILAAVGLLLAWHSIDKAFEKGVGAKINTGHGTSIEIEKQNEEK